MSSITESKLKQIIKEELSLLKLQIDEARNKDQFAHKFSSVFIEALELDPETETGKNTLNEVYSFLTQYTLNEAADRWEIHRVSTGAINPTAEPTLRLGKGQGSSLNGLVKLFELAPNNAPVPGETNTTAPGETPVMEYAVQLNVGRLTPQSYKFVQKAVDDLLSKVNTNGTGKEPNSFESLADNAGPLKGLGEAIEYPEDLKTIPVNMIMRYIENAATLVPGMGGNELLEIEAFARYMALMATDLVKTDREGYTRVNNAAQALRQAVRTQQTKASGPQTSLTHRRVPGREVTESLEGSEGNGS